MLVPAMAQDSLHTIGLDETIISANKFEENKKNIAQSIQVINRKQIEWMMPQTSATLLEQTGNVFVQRSQAGGGSPVLRGFEASRVLLVVDGVRQNNAIYRAGHLQNVITIDNNILDRVEVLYGPSSTLYGSDALGGVVLFNTKRPQLSETGKMTVGGNAMVRYSSAYGEQTGHADVNLGFKNFASLTSVTASRFGDLKQGTERSADMDSLGLRYNYVTQINGVDSMVANPDPEKQIQSGYDQIDVLQKFLYRQNDKLTHQVNLQFSNSTNIPRYDRLTEYRNGKLRFAEWYYGPQLRTLAGYRLEARNLNGLVDEVNVGINYQMIEESRYQRNYGNNNLQARIEKVNVIGYNVDGRRRMGRHELIVGLDGQYNDVKSEAHNRNIKTEVEAPLDTRYPSGGSKMMYGAIYGQHIYKIVADKLILNDGVRLNYVDLNAKFTDKTFFPFPYSEAKQQHLAASGNLGLVYMPAKDWRVVLNGATGFRAPNVDDLAKVFESAGGGMLVVPNPDLKPEHTYNLDLGIAYSSGERFKAEVTGFYTWFRNAIVTDKFKLGGADSIMYNGKMTAVMASQNKATANVLGFNAAITVGIEKGLSLYSTINYTYGRYKGLNGVEVPLDHIPPVYGKTSLIYNRKNFTGEFFALYNGWKKVADYSPSGEDNLVYATPAGMPSWYTLNIRAGYMFNAHFGAELAIENILDRNYRVFASGISAPGRNLVATLRARL
ncbi:MAG: TonB-dependent receptor [Sphingobacteriales bacterium]|nr:MAG: TonB-dependent receptor [Sphingobacteriales bacterium]